jgi:hypothetical protein
MNNKLQKDSNQLSLTLDATTETELSPIRRTLAKVVVMPSSPQDQGPTFRERVVRDLIRTRVMVSD